MEKMKDKRYHTSKREEIRNLNNPGSDKFVCSVGSFDGISKEQDEILPIFG